MTGPLYYRRSVSGRDDVSAVVVYALFPEASTPSPDLVARVGAFPPGYRPTNRARELLAEPDALQFWTCDVKRAQLRHYTPLTEPEAFALYPRLPRFINEARRSLASMGDLPSGRATFSS